MFDNSTRWHSSLGYVSSTDFEPVATVACLSVRFSLTTTSFESVAGRNQRRSMYSGAIGGLHVLVVFGSDRQPQFVKIKVELAIHSRNLESDEV
jgi:hypothetical protein